MTDSECKPLRVSWSNLQRFSQCGMQARLMREGKREKGIVNQRNFLGGNITDNAMRRWLELKEPTSEPLFPYGQVLFDEYLEKQKGQIKWKGSEKEDKKKVLTDVEEALTTLEPWLKENVLPYSYQPEARGTSRMLIEDIDGTLRCVDLFYAIDIAVKLPDGFKLYDLKTTRNEQYVKGKTLGQLSFYQFAWMVKFKMNKNEFLPSAFVTPLTRDLITEVIPGPTEFQLLASRITQYAQAAWNNVSPTKTEIDSDCRYSCEVRNSCPLYRLPQTIKSGKMDFSKLLEAQKLLSDTTELDKLGRSYE